jgi:hypothetical protein
MPNFGTARDISASFTLQYLAGDLTVSFLKRSSGFLLYCLEIDNNIDQQQRWIEHDTQETINASLCSLYLRSNVGVKDTGHLLPG